LLRYHVTTSFLKIAIVHEMLVKLGGAEKVVKKLTEMFPKSPIYTLFHNANKTEEWFKGQKIHTSWLQKRYDTLKNPRLLLAKMPRAIESFEFSRFDAVISSSSGFAHGIETPKKVKHICYCHSPMRYAWDYTHRYLEKSPWLFRFFVAELLRQIRLWDYETSERADLILANSEHVRKRIFKYWRKEAQVLYPPVNVKAFSPTSSHEDFFLIVSALTPFKRIDLAIEAFNKLGRRLVIIGDGAQRKVLESLAKENIEFLGRKPDDVVREYMQNCRALVFPGEEDFGITPIEAMASGKPVLAYGKGGVLESVIAGKTGEFFSKPTAASLTKGLTELMVNEKNYDPKKIRKQAEKFDESVFEERIDSFLKNV
jgi:glycosyltransferase involved in cell wall biosynthesis